MLSVWSWADIVRNSCSKVVAIFTLLPVEVLLIVLTVLLIVLLLIIVLLAEGVKRRYAREAFLVSRLGLPCCTPPAPGSIVT